MNTKRWLPKVSSAIIVAALLLSWNATITEATLSNPSAESQCPSTPIPGGGTLTFVSNRDGDNDLYVIDGDECNIYQLTNDGISGTGAWSPDNSEIVFTNGQYLYVMNADGTARRQLLSSAPGTTQVIPSWSPDYSKIVFNIDLGSYYGQEIFVVNADGSNLLQLTNNPHRDNHSPSWSPDSSQIVFMSRRDPGNDGEVWIMNADGTNQHAIMPDNGWPDSYVSMSPDGTKVAFSTKRDGNHEIYVMDSDGSNPTRLTDDPGHDDWPRWSPDGTRIAFHSNRNGSNDIYVMYADGSNQTRVTNSPAQDILPFWGGPSLNKPPSVSANGPYFVDEGSSIVVTASGSDPDGDPLTYAWDLDHDGSFETAGQSVTFSASELDGPSTYTIAVKVADPLGHTSTNNATVTVQNVPPTIGPITASLEPIQVSSMTTAASTFTDQSILDTHSAVWNWGDGSTSPGTVDETGGTGTVTGIHSFNTPGIYNLNLTVTDDDGGETSQNFQYVVVYDPVGGFVTGGGWIYSEPGAYQLDPLLEGKATFGFVAKYKKGTNAPDGNTEFQFKAGDLNFHSTSYDWLVVTGSDYAKLKGTGTINGEGEYKFQIWAGDDDPDTFRIKIWYEEGDKEVVVYDNVMDQAIGGGSIVIHTK